ncbi:MAG TPA: hypothetical protein VM802_19720 [Chitinophaga sp.]|uniref:hypothetical protein n=1 Tax=Chitinophaga sp. TaxID=1869181 RepID=UPI002C882B31|nr:hypothetical protein [Chitinophaga sp.]HVI47115.1 hypothetical protein [Chitinophaga sp.]
MRLLLWMSIIILSTLEINAQVTMTVQIPPAGVLQKSQLWSILLVSAADHPLGVKIILRLMDSRTNQPLLTGVSNRMVIVKGARLLQAVDVAPVQYEYLSPVIERSENGFLSAGNYVACYSLFIEGYEKGNLSAEDCMPFAVEPASPVMLNTPANMSVLEIPVPQFTWLPPAPQNIFNKLNYDLTLVELKGGQSAVEAIQQNIPVYRVNRIEYLFANYPASAPLLDTGKVYAWTVTARNGLQFAGQAEVWTFRVKKQMVKNEENKEAYIQLKKELDAAVTNSGNIIHFNYRNETGDSTIPYEILALDMRGESIAKGDLAIKRGENMMDLKIGRGRLENGQHYLLRLLNSRKEYWQMRFIYTED